MAEREQPAVARDPGWRSRRSRPLRCPSGRRKPPRPIQTSVKLASELGRPVTWRAREPSSRPLRPFCSPQGALKGPVASTGGLAERGSRSLAEAQRPTRGRHRGPSDPPPRSETSWARWGARVPSSSFSVSLDLEPFFFLFLHHHTQNLKDFHKALSKLQSKPKVRSLTLNKSLASKILESQCR